MSGLHRLYSILRRKAIQLFYRRPKIGRFLVPVNGLTTFKNICLDATKEPKLWELNSQNYYYKILDEEVCQRKEPLSLGLESEMTAFARGVERYQHGYKYKAPEVFLALIHNGRVLSDSFLILSPTNCIILDSVWRKFHLEEIQELYARRLPPVHRRVKRCAVLGARWSKSYYHWLIDTLPRLFVLEKVDLLDETPLLLPSNLTQTQYESLHLLGISRDQIMGFDGGHWEVDQMYFPSVLARTGNSRPLTALWLRDRFSGALGLSNKQRIPRRRLYVSRRDARKRKVLNEQHITSFLDERGFEIVCPGEMCFREQVRRFSTAEVIVGPHGAGLANSVFAPPGATLVELFPSNYVNGCYWALANVCGHRYAFIIGEQRASDFEVSLDKVEKLFERLGFD